VIIRWLIICALFAAAFGARGETVVSQSQQFVIHFSTNVVAMENIPFGSVEVVPEFLAVTAERVKRAVTGEIPAVGEARGVVHVGILATTKTDGLIGIASSKYADGWRYEMAVPRVSEEARLVKGFVNVLLLQYANRGVERSAELPAWLTEGLAEQLFYSIGPSLVVRRAPTAWESNTRDLQHWTREMLRTNATPMFQDLTTALVPVRHSAPESIYLAGTHLLVRALLETPNGRQRFGRFLQLLPRTWNWQTAFMQAFEFRSMLDVEKWWSLTVIEFTTRDQRQAWSQEMSLGKLDDLVRVRVEHRDATNALPEVRLVELKTIFADNDADLQQQAAESMVSQLKYTSAHMAPPVAAIALGYQKTLEFYLQTHRRSDTLRRIEGLDQQRRSMADRMTAAR
jgi:hypothetical protein